jgi:hypothetical protein
MDAAIDHRHRPKPNIGWIAFLLAVLGIKLAAFVLDPAPKLFFGDSVWYIGTAFLDWIPPDRSFTYGYLIKLVTLGSHSLTELVVFQVLASAASAVLLAYALKRYFFIGPAIACACGILCALEPIQLLYERYALTETFSLFYFALYMVCSFDYLRRPRLGALCLVQVLGVALVSLRVSFLPVVLANAPILPLLAAFALARQDGAAPSCRGFGSPPAARPRALLTLGVHLLVAAGLTVTLHTGYKQIYSTLTGNPPGYNAASGHFILSIWAPVVEPVDFPYPELRTAVFGDLLYDRKDRFTRTMQLFAEGGLVERISGAVSESRSNAAALQTAMNALKRDPLGVARLSLQTLGDYFNPRVLRESILNDLAMDDDQIDLYHRYLKVFGEYAHFHDRAEQQAMTPMKSYYQAAVPWFWLLLFTPILCTAAFFCAKDLRVRVLTLELHVAIYGCVAVACFLTVIPVARYLQPVSWLLFFPVAILADRMLDAGKSTGIMPGAEERAL